MPMRKFSMRTTCKDSYGIDETLLPMTMQKNSGHDDLDPEIHIGENERYMTPSPTDTDSQSVMNLASDVAEQLSMTLQACLRTCVRQHAFPSLQPTPMPSSSFSQQHLSPRTQQHGPLSNFSTTSLSNSVATTNSANQRLSGDFNSECMAATLLSPLCAEVEKKCFMKSGHEKACILETFSSLRYHEEYSSLSNSSRPSNITLTPSSDLRSHSPKSRLNGGNYHNRNQPQGSPLLQIPPPPPSLSASSWEEVNQMPGGRLSNRSADLPSETPPRHSSPASQCADAILSTKQFTPKMRLYSIPTRLIEDEKHYEMAKQVSHQSDSTMPTPFGPQKVTEIISHSVDSYAYYTTTIFHGAKL
ncbi:hypothetical protein ACTXT7_005998 [Hymenolepis weldensis]